jgi:hypothetical protein
MTPEPSVLHNLMELTAHHARLHKLADACLPTPSITGGLAQTCIPAVQEALAQDLVSDHVVTCHKDLVSDHVKNSTE